MSNAKNLVLAAALAGGALTFAAGPSLAAVVCVGEDCWHAKEHYEYPPDAHIVIHEDGWKWKDNDHFRWREHDGRGYWAGGEWRSF
jgi:hypothetical protein